MLAPLTGEAEEDADRLEDVAELSAPAVAADEAVAVPDADEGEQRAERDEDGPGDGEVQTGLASALDQQDAPRGSLQRGRRMRQQEMLSPRLKKLRENLSQSFPQEIPESLNRAYQRPAQAMFKLWGLLMTNTRMLVLFIFLFVGQPIWYFWIEVTLLNLLLAYLIYRQENLAQSLIGLATTR